METLSHPVKTKVTSLNPHSGLCGHSTICGDVLEMVKVGIKVETVGKP